MNIYIYIYIYIHTLVTTISFDLIPRENNSRSFSRSVFLLYFG